jgi:hypothetical protein
MHYDIRTAALCDDSEKRVKLAAKLLAAYKINARVDPWDGTRCHLVVAAGDDAYGVQAMAIARRRGTPVLSMLPGATGPGTDGQGDVACDIPAARLVKWLAELLEGRADAEDAAGPDIQDRLPCLLASNRYRGKRVTIASGSVSVLIDPQSGRAYAPTHSDLLHAQDNFCKAGWTVTHGNTANFVLAQCAFAGLEPFMIAATQRGRQLLPEYPAGHYRLDTWPDFGSLPSMAKLMHIVSTLTTDSSTPQQLESAKGKTTSRAEVDALLWALAAVDLLKTAGSGPAAANASTASPRKPARSGIWGAIARRFGLVPEGG